MNIIIPFPLERRTAKIGDVAVKLGATKTDRHARHYRELVTRALQAQLARSQVPVALHFGPIAGFWRAVDLHIARQRRENGGGRPFGAV